LAIKARGGAEQKRQKKKGGRTGEEPEKSTHKGDG